MLSKVRRLTCCALLLTSSLAGHSTLSAATISNSDAELLRSLILLSGLASAGIHRDTEGLWQYASSVMTTTGITLLAKELIDAERPNGEDNDRFPSGHSATAFAGAAFLHKRYGMKYGLPAYLAATSVAWSRIDNDQHRVGDVLAGGILALVVNHKLVSSQTRLVTELSPTAFTLNIKHRW